MSHQKSDGGPRSAVAEDVTLITSEEAPEKVICAVSKRQIPREDARHVAYSDRKSRWVHKRYLGEFDVKDGGDGEDNMADYGREGEGSPVAATPAVQDDLEAELDEELAAPAETEIAEG